MAKPMCLNDTLLFGKHQGKTVGEVLTTFPEWLLWFRDKKAEEGNVSFFTNQVLILLDDQIKQNTTLAKRHILFETVIISDLSTPAEIVAKTSPKERPPDWGSY